jgi:hypothetical protein
MSVVYSADEIWIERPLKRIDLIFDAMSFNVAEGRISVSNGVFKSLREQLGE